MSQQKTMIWRSGLSGLTGSAENDTASGARAPDSQAAAAPPPPDPVPQPAPESVPSVAAHPQSAPSSGTRIMGSGAFAHLIDRPAATPAQLPATRVLSIDELFPQAAAATDVEVVSAPAAKQPTGESPRDVAQQDEEALPPSELRALLHRAQTMVRQHRGRTALYAGLALVLALVLLWPTEPSHSASPGNAVSVTAPSIVPALPEARVSPAQAVSNPAASTGSVDTGARGQQRAATDALAAGDFARAARLYAELAKSAPAPSAYSEAARILAALSLPQNHQ